MFIGIAINLTGRLLASASPAALFANGEIGAWYDPSQINTLFQDIAGNTPVTAPNQTVGLMLDKSKGLVLGPELVTNGNFDTDTVWTKSATTITGGALVFSGVAEASATQPSIFIANQIYELVLDIATATAGTLLILSGSGQTMPNASFTTSGIKRIKLRPQTTGTLIIYTNTSFVGTVNSISIKLLAGNHATQATSTQRPIYGINPITGTRNLMTYTEQLDNAAWTKTNATITANAVTAPDGSLTADQINGTGASTVQAPSVTLAAGISAVFSVWLRSATGSNQTVYLSISGAGTTGFTVTPTWQRFSAVWLSPSAGTWYGRITSVGTYNVYAWGAQLEQSATATAYQKVVTQYEVTEAGVQSASYIAFDGVDDGMVTGTITPATDKVQVFAGVRKLSDAARGMLLSSGTSVGTFEINAPTASLNGYAFASTGSAQAVASVSGFSAPRTDILTGIGDIVADTAILRVDGSQVASSSTDQGTGNFLAYPLYIGRRGGTTLPFNGRIYSMIVRFGANLTAGQITATESWVNGETGAY